MGQEAAKAGDTIEATDIHNVINPDGSVVPQSSNFVGMIKDGCIDSVKIKGQPAAVMGAKAKNMAIHVPIAPGVSFQAPPQNEGEIIKGSMTVNIGGKPAARMNDLTRTCTDIPGPPGKVVVKLKGSVTIGG